MTKLVTRKLFARWMVGVGLLIVLAVVGFRFWVLHTLKSAISAAPTSSTTSRIVRDAEAGLGGIRGPHTGSGVNVGALSNGTALQMAEVFRDSDVRRAVLAAVDSDDPAVWAQASRMSLMCMDFRFSATATTVTADMIKTDQPLSTEAAAAAARAINAIRDAPPSRVAPPVALRGLIGELVAAFALGNKLLNIDPEIVELLAGAQKAQLDAPEPQVLNETVRQTRAMCASFPFEEFWQRYPNAKNRWAAKGALGALIGNTQSGWTSTDFSSLAAADFALVERAIAERQADGLVALLSSSNASSLRLLELDASQSTYVPGLGMSAGRQVADIALCQLGIADCSSQSPAFKDACATYGGCHQPDLAALMRYVLARDDMDPTLFDRNADRVTGAIYANNLELLGIRRTRDEK